MRPVIPRQNPPAVRFAAGRHLTPDQRREVLAAVVDVYRDGHGGWIAPWESKGVDRDGEERGGPAYSPELFVKSAITGRMVRYYVTLPDGRRAHPSELFPTVTDAEIEREMARRREQERAARERDANRQRRIIPAGDHRETFAAANAAYTRTNRQRWHSYLAVDPAENVVRVDGADPDDVAYYAVRGFQPWGAPILPNGSEMTGARDVMGRILSHGQPTTPDVAAFWPDLVARYGNAVVGGPAPAAPPPPPHRPGEQLRLLNPVGDHAAISNPRGHSRRCPGCHAAVRVPRGVRRFRCRSCDALIGVQ